MPNIEQSEIKYEIINDEEIIGNLNIDNIKENGYKIIENDKDFYLIISYGEVISCCDNLSIKDIKINEKNIKVEIEYADVCDCIPNKTIYPKVVIKLNQRLNNININNNSYKTKLLIIILYCNSIYKKNLHIISYIRGKNLHIFTIHLSLRNQLYLNVLCHFETYLLHPYLLHI